MEEEVFELRPWHLVWTLLVVVVGLIGLIPQLSPPAPTAPSPPVEESPDAPDVFEAFGQLDEIRPFVNRMEELRELPATPREREALLEEATRALRKAREARATLIRAGADSPRSSWTHVFQSSLRYLEILQDTRRWLETGRRNP